MTDTAYGLIMGAYKHGNKELVAACDGFRESKLSFQRNLA